MLCRAETDGDPFRPFSLFSFLLAIDDLDQIQVVERKNDQGASPPGNPGCARASELRGEEARCA
jgi:hypothetical protein